jgi:hypothetical protein
MQRYIILFFTCFVFFFQLKAQEYKHTPKYSTVLKIDQISTPEYNVTDSWQLEKRDIEILEKNFKKLTLISRVDLKSYKIKEKNLDTYVYQYVGVIIDNKKYIYINAFAFSEKKGFDEFQKNWKTEFVNPHMIMDGGTGYFRVLFNIEELKFEQLIFNGMG